MWYVRVDGLHQNELRCPRCNSHFHNSPIFDHDKRACLNCKANLVEWNTISFIYVIDVDNAPEIIKLIINFTEPLTEQEAEKHIMILSRFFNDEQI